MGNETKSAYSIVEDNHNIMYSYTKYMHAVPVYASSKTPGGRFLCTALID